MPHTISIASIVTGLRWSFQRISSWGFVLQFTPSGSGPALRAGCIGCQQQFEFDSQFTLEAVERQLALHRDTCERLHSLVKGVTDTEAGCA